MLAGFSDADLKNRPSKRNLPDLLSYLGKVMVQDMPLVLRQDPDHPAGKLLLGHPDFTYATIPVSVCFACMSWQCCQSALHSELLQACFCTSLT